MKKEATASENADIKNEQLAKLYQVFPEAFSDGKVNWDKLRATLGENAELGEQYGLGWKGKSKIFGTIQSRTAETLKPLKKSSQNWDAAENMFIIGDNLSALKILHKAYYNQVKTIYIDPPYNTGNDFIYNDKFAATTAAYNIGAANRDQQGNLTRADGLIKNTRDSGRLHSNWLSMIYPRLFLARNLLSPDGVIFITIDDHEAANLRLVMDEIFGAENFVANFIWQHRKSSQNDTDISLSHSYILCYAKNRDDCRLNPLPINDSRFANPDHDPRGDWTLDPMDAPHVRPNLVYPITNPLTGVQHFPPKGRHWRISPAKAAAALADNRIIFGKKGTGKPQIKHFKSEAVGKGANPYTIWTDVGTAFDATKECAALFDGKKYFDTPKPVQLIKEMLKIGSSRDSLVMDFFAGSGTTAQAVAELNGEDGGCRRWLLVQLPEAVAENSELQKDGYLTIADIALERIRRAGAALAKTCPHQNGVVVDSTNFRAYQIAASNFKKWNPQPKNITELRANLRRHINPLVPKTTDENLLTELLLKNGISPLQNITAKNDYFLAPRRLVICLSRALTPAIFRQILAEKPAKIILLDQAFKNNACLKVNLLLDAEQQGIYVEVI